MTEQTFGFKICDQNAGTVTVQARATKKKSGSDKFLFSSTRVQFFGSINSHQTFELLRSFYFTSFYKRTTGTENIYIST